MTVEGRCSYCGADAGYSAAGACEYCGWIPGPAAKNAKVTATDGSVEYLHYVTPGERQAAALERIAAATEEWLPRIASALEHLAEEPPERLPRQGKQASAYQKALDLIVAQQDRIGRAYEALGPAGDVDVDLDENIRQLRAELDELREKVERYEGLIEYLDRRARVYAEAEGATS